MDLVDLSGTGFDKVGDVDRLSVPLVVGSRGEMGMVALGEGGGGRG